MKSKVFIVALLLSFKLLAQDAVSYQLPPQDIADLLLAKPTPAVSIDSKAAWMLLSERNSYPSIEELAMPELRIAGLRINPNNYSLSRQSFINNFTLQQIATNKGFNIAGLPLPLMASGVSWSPNETKIAFIQNNPKNIDLYVIDVAAHKAVKVNKKSLNTVLGNSYTWLDDNTIVYKAATQPANAAPAKPLAPKGPTVQQNLGKAAPSVTYQDLIKSPYDEALFDFYATSELIQIKNGVETVISKPAIYSSYTASPDKKYWLIKTLHKPFSYLVGASGFPSTVAIYDAAGKFVTQLAELPSTETKPSGYDNVQNVQRTFDWRDDEAATVTWCMPLDSGLIKKPTEYHDMVYALSAPFNVEPKELFKTKMRYRGVQWGNENLALISEGSQAKQMTKISYFNPSSGAVKVLYEKPSTDAYSFLGYPATYKNKFGREVIQTTDNGTKILMNNTTGSSPKGDLPFLSKWDIATGENEIIWRCSEGTFEYVTDVLNTYRLTLLVRKENKTTPPNYFIKDIIAKIADRPLTNFTNPYKAIEGVSKEQIKYKRADGVDLTGTLYLPKGYSKEKDGTLPVLIWAYPREFQNVADAAQVRGNQNRFTTISWASPIFFVTQGFAVLDNAEMPIVSTIADKKPNDDFINQLQLNAEAAINKLSEMGVGDKNRMAVGGHSYGAFMTANLLAHTHLFKAGIARSGAYNRTLTPFGFQNEERTYWQAPQLYYEMSPFSYADKIKTPLLLIHGDSDDNPGTFPINSERLFNAIKGNGGTVRFVSLPYEAHSYRSKENLLHMLWEMNNWLDKYVKK
ncbi:MAG: prolyl oligopeptidase family serine peptidase [Bacteroidetes bacterium]|nr:prolyl oligopeptidase family serine peptidase [Bacteroidota bacterium]